MSSNYWKKNTLPVDQLQDNDEQFESRQKNGQKKNTIYYQDNDDNDYQIDTSQSTNSYPFKTNPKMLILIFFPFILLFVFMGIGVSSQKQYHKKIQKTKTGFDPLLDLQYRQQNQSKIVITSCNKKFTPQEQYTAKVQEITSFLQKKQYANQKRFKRTNALKRNLVGLLGLSLSQIVAKASARLHNPQYPQFIRQIANYQPYEDLPFCLFVKQTSESQAQKKVQIQIAKSIFMLNYTNYITVFYSETQKRGLKVQQLSQLSQQALKIYELTSNRMFYKIVSNSTNYYGYKYLMKELCVDKSYVMFVSNVIKNNTLSILNKYHQFFPVYLTFTENSDFYLVNSFAMRLFELIDLNDFNGTNSQFLEKPNSEAFFSIALIQLSKKYTKKFPLSEIYDPISPAIEDNKWVLAIFKSNKTLYKRQDYQYLIKLSQTYKIQNIQQSQKILRELKSGNVQYNPNENTQLKPMQMIDAIATQQSLFLPFQNSLNKKQYVQFDSKYGPTMRQQKSRPITFDEKPICVTFLANNQSNMSVSSKKRTLTSLRSVLKQNYTKFNIFLYDGGLESQTIEQIHEILKQYQFPPNRYLYFKSNMVSIFNIVKCAFTRCGANQLQLVIDSDFQIIGSNYFQLINFIHHYNPHAWVIHANYKTETLKFGTSYRIVRDQQYRDFQGRVKNLNFLSPLAAWEVKLIRSIPLNYHLDPNQDWLKNYWHKSLMHSLSQLATVSHMEYIPEIVHEASSLRLEQEYNYSNTTIQGIINIIKKPILRPLSSLGERYRQYQKLVYKRIASDQKV